MFRARKMTVFMGVSRWLLAMIFQVKRRCGLQVQEQEGSSSLCSVADRMETLLGFIRLNRHKSVEGEFLHCHLLLPLTIKE